MVQQRRCRECHTVWGSADSVPAELHATMGARKQNKHSHLHKLDNYVDQHQLHFSSDCLPEQWGNLSPEAQWSHCWPTTPGRHKHWPDSGLHEFPYEPSSEQWQAVDRTQEPHEKQVQCSATRVKTAWNQNAMNGPKWFPQSDSKSSIFGTTAP